MKLTINELRKIIRESIEEVTSEIDEKKKKDQDGDGKSTYRDVLIAKMIASGMPKDQAIEKAKKIKISEDQENLDDLDPDDLKKVADALKQRQELDKKTQDAIQKVSGVVNKK